MSEDLCFCRLCGDATSSPVFLTPDLETYRVQPCLIQLWKLSSEGKCLTLHYPESLEFFFASLKEKEKKIFSIPSYLKYCVFPLEPDCQCNFRTLTAAA